MTKDANIIKVLPEQYDHSSTLNYTAIQPSNGPFPAVLVLFQQSGMFPHTILSAKSQILQLQSSSEQHKARNL